MVDKIELRVAIVKANKNISQVSEELGVSTCTLRRWLNGEGLQVKDAERLAKHLGIPREKWVDIFFAKEVE